jgi:uncharacterized integral membrane protein
MSATPGQQQQVAGEYDEPRVPRRSRREKSRTVALLVLAILATLFAVKNSGEVKVDWIVGSGRAPLVIVIIVSLLVGIVFTHFAERLIRKRR